VDQVAPEGDEKFPRQGHDRRPAVPAAAGTDALAEPPRGNARDQGLKLGDLTG